MATGTGLQKSDCWGKQSQGVWEPIWWHGRVYSGACVWSNHVLETPWEGEIRENMSAWFLPTAYFPSIKFLPTKHLLHYWVLPLGNIRGLLHCQIPHPTMHASSRAEQEESKALAWGRSAQLCCWGSQEGPVWTRAWSVPGRGCVVQRVSRAAGIWTGAEGSNRPSGSPFSIF